VVQGPDLVDQWGDGSPVGETTIASPKGYPARVRSPAETAGRARVGGSLEAATEAGVARGRHPLASAMPAGMSGRRRILGLPGCQSQPYFLARELRPCQFPATVTVLKRAARLPIGRRSIRPDRRPRHAVVPEN
jgi:hypothetical protein